MSLFLFLMTCANVVDVISILRILYLATIAYSSPSSSSSSSFFSAIDTTTAAFPLDENNNIINNNSAAAANENHNHNHNNNPRDTHSSQICSIYICNMLFTRANSLFFISLDTHYVFFVVSFVSEMVPVFLLPDCLWFCLRWRKCSLSLQAVALFLVPLLSFEE